MSRTGRALRLEVDAPADGRPRAREGGTVKFMLMMQGSQKGWEAMGTWSPADLEAHFAFMAEFVKALTDSGELVLAAGLDVPANAKVVRNRAGVAVTDGPFAESKEFLAGYWIVDVDTLDRAVEIARQASAAPGRGGVPVDMPIEIRQVMSGPPDVDV